MVQILRAGQEDAPAGGEKSEDGAGSGLDVSLMDIFEKETGVDENLKDLADSQDDVIAADLATKLRDFLEALQE